MITITKGRLLTIKQWRETYGPGSNVVLPAEEAEELARIALAALEAEPIGFRCRRNDNLGDWSYVYHREPDDFERKHLVIEGIYAAPPAPVVPEEKPMPNPLSMYAVDAVAAIAEVRGWNACRAAMLQSGNFRENKNSSTNNFREIAETSTNYPVIPSEVLSAILKVAKIRADFDDFDGDRRGIGDCLDEAEQELIVTINKYASQLAAEPIATNDVREQTAVPPVPVTPDGWISCSDRMPEMGERQYYVLAADFKNNYPPSIPNTQVGVYGDWFNDGNPTWDDGDGEDLHLKEVTHWMPLPEPPQEVNRG
ncbi:DUF551 domain-containing protein [Escherichia coli]|uniref:EaA protein n=5 Tax=root TaxID=1 RepID=A0A0H4IU61_9CAUD|nr:DUF551 domain-containing protein [Shigella sonnei]YP_009190518.1 DUF551 domain-containing protein [Shigella phage Ss-VASD]EED1247730.1 DUF551 domain-containing protein [Escherichia coli]EHQ5580358.1 DUF551 domain-containing protein [Escherichia coli O2]EIA9695398.1 DUF551 domain-containing protein [Escherichia coli O157]EKK2471729.1 DUF551 domain-containing protein [Escherichia coli O91]ELW32113.1 hypothetical protein EC34880_3048 [Escherichia coli 3.4880]MBZ4068116.1 DUF551 domain-contai